MRKGVAAFAALAIALTGVAGTAGGDRTVTRVSVAGRLTVLVPACWHGLRGWLSDVVDPAIGPGAHGSVAAMLHSSRVAPSALRDPTPLLGAAGRRRQPGRRAPASFTVARRRGDAGTRHVTAGERRGVLRIPAGASTARLDFSESAGVIRLLRVVVPAGTRADLTGVVRGVAGVRISTPVARNDPSEACARLGRAEVCTQSEEACPMPAATWHFRLIKLAGPAGWVRVEFVVSQAPLQWPR